VLFIKKEAPGWTDWSFLDAKVWAPRAFHRDGDRFLNREGVCSFKAERTRRIRVLDLQLMLGAPRSMRPSAVLTDKALTAKLTSMSEDGRVLATMFRP